jgi:hypothetical protein
MSTADNPYVGPKPFGPNESDRFFGRREETAELLSLVQSERLVLLFAPSGAGKSSLINAKLTPALEQRDYVVLPVARVSGEPTDLSQSPQFDNIFTWNLIDKINSQTAGEVPDRRPNMTLVDFLGAYNELDDEDEEEFELLPQVLIIDQFEEIFTAHPTYWEHRQQFFQQLRDAMEADPLLWVIISMREDYLARVEPYAYILPGQLRTRFYLQPLKLSAAREAIELPAAQAGIPFAPGVAGKLVEDLAQVYVHQDGDSGRELTPWDRMWRRIRPQAYQPGWTDARISRPGQFVEPVQLQVVCLGLWQRLPPGTTQISGHFLAEDVEDSLAEYYEDNIRQIAAKGSVKERLIRNWFEHQLISESDVREQVTADDKQAGGLAIEVVEQLSEARLVHSERRSGARRYELAHDRLIEPVRKNNRAWRLATRNKNLLIAGTSLLGLFIVLAVILVFNARTLPIEVGEDRERFLLPFLPHNWTFQHGSELSKAESALVATIITSSSDINITVRDSDDAALSPLVVLDADKEDNRTIPMVYLLGRGEQYQIEVRGENGRPRGYQLSLDSATLTAIGEQLRDPQRELPALCLDVAKTDNLPLADVEDVCELAMELAREENDVSSRLLLCSGLRGFFRQSDISQTDDNPCDFRHQARPLGWGQEANMDGPSSQVWGFMGWMSHTVTLSATAGLDLVLYDPEVIRLPLEVTDGRQSVVLPDSGFYLVHASDSADDSVNASWSLEVNADSRLLTTDGTRSDDCLRAIEAKADADTGGAVLGEQPDRVIEDACWQEIAWTHHQDSTERATRFEELCLILWPEWSDIAYPACALTELDFLLDKVQQGTAEVTDLANLSEICFRIPAGAQSVVPVCGQAIRLAQAAGDRMGDMLCEELFRQDLRISACAVPISLGEPVTGTLDSGSSMLWAFATDIPERFVDIRLQAGSVISNPILALSGPDGRRMAVDDETEGDGNARLIVRPPQVGGYVIEANAPGDRAGDVITATLQLVSPHNLEPGEIATGALMVGSTDLTSFQGSAGQLINVVMMGEEEGLDPYLLLFGPDGNRLEVDNDSGRERNAWIKLQLSQDGTYVIEASGHKETEGSYTLSLNEVSAEHIARSEIVTGELANESADFWRSSNLAGQIVVITMRATDDDFVPILSIIDPRFEVLDNDNNALAEDVARLRVRLPQDGEYVLAASGKFGESGVYSLSVEEIEFDTGQVVTADLADGSSDRWAFNGVKDREVILRMHAEEAGLDPHLELIGPDQEVVDSADDRDGDRSAQLVVKLPEDGDYVLVATARSLSGSGGRYTLEFLDITPGEIELGETVVGDKAAEDDDEWIFSGQAGQEVVIRMTVEDGGFEPSIALVGPDQEFLASSVGDPSASLVIRLPQDGSYSIVASSTERAGGRYTLSLEEAARGGIVQEIEGGLAVLGDLIPGSSDRWSFGGQEGQGFIIRMNAADDSLDPFLILLDTNSEEVDSDDDGGGNLNSRIVVTSLPLSGQYVIEATGFGGSGGRYTLSIEEITLENIVLGQQVTGTLSAGSLEQWRYAGQAEEVIVVEMTRQDDSFDPRLEIIGPEGNQLAWAEDFDRDGNTLLAFRFPRDGEYVIQASGSGRSDGPDEPYSLTVEALASATKPQQVLRLFPTSVDGKALLAYRLGDGPRGVVIVGGIHAGLAPASVTFVWELLQHFGENPEDLPDDISLYLLPNVNQDSPRTPGRVRGRLNANGVDLNRNWGCNWQEISYLDVERTISVSGGEEPFSEPETRALRNFFEEVRPGAVLFYGAASTTGRVAGGFCDGDDAGAGALVETYAQASNYEPVQGLQGEGEAHDWLASQQIPAVFVLLKDHVAISDEDWQNNLDGLLAVLNNSP